MKYVVELNGRTVEVLVDGEQVTVAGRVYTASLHALPGTPLRQLVVDGRARTVAVQAGGRGRWIVTGGGERREVEVVDERTRHIRSLAARPDRERTGGVLKAPMPGLVVRVLVEPGQTVAPGAGVLVLEAMKMENELRTTVAGTVRAVLVRQGLAVEKGQVLIELD